MRRMAIGTAQQVAAVGDGVAGVALSRARRRWRGFPQGVFDRLCVPRFHLSTRRAQWVELKA